MIHSITTVIKKMIDGEQPTISELAQNDQIYRYTALQIASGETVEVEQVLYEICDNVHAQCYDACPVYALMTDKEKKNFSCAYHKNGAGMLRFIKSRI